LSQKTRYTHNIFFDCMNKKVRKTFIAFIAVLAVIALVGVTFLPFIGLLGGGESQSSVVVDQEN